MPISIPRLRNWFAIVAVALVVVVAAFYFYAQFQGRFFLRQIPQKLGVEVQQSTQGFSLSKSEGGRTLFTIRAANAVQYKEGGRAELHDVSIVVYGRQANRFDQISGSEFDYDPQAGTVAARGEVQIDLQGNASGPVQPDQAAPKELQNPIHVKANGLVFNQKTGIAHTDEYVEFRIPQGNGSAIGATYDSKNNALVLASQVSLRTSTDQPTVVTAEHGSITKEPRRLDLTGARVRQQGRDFRSDRLELFLNSDNDIDRAVANGNVQLNSTGSNGATLDSPHAEMTFTGENQIKTAVFTGGVHLQGHDANAAEATAGRMVVEFSARNQVRMVHASEGLRMDQRQVPIADQQQPATGASGASQRQRMEIVTAAADFYVKDGRLISNAQSLGPAQVTLTPVAPAVAGERTVISSARMRAEFGNNNHLSLVRGEPDAKITSIVPGEPDKVSTSNSLVAHFGPDGGILDVVQQGNFRYAEAALKNSPMGPGGRFAYATRARYTPEDDTLALTGSPRVVDGGMTVTANTVRIERRGGDAFAQGAVKTTYSELKQNPGGAILATADPVHVTSDNANVRRETGIGRYVGHARLWQGADVVEAPVIEFDQTKRSLLAEGTAAQPVTSVFVQRDNKGKVTTVVVRAARLVYSDTDRQARYTGGVVAKSEDLTVTMARAVVLLDAAGEKAANKSSALAGGPSRLNQIIANDHVIVQQQDRQATGDKLVYTAADQKCVLTGGPPTLADPEHGTVRGDSLTFYTRDDRVLVESNQSSRTITRTRVTR